MRVLSWLLLAGWLSGCVQTPPAPLAASPSATPRPAPSASLKAYIQSRPEPAAVALYLNGDKVGWEIEKWSVGPPPADLSQPGEVAWVELESRMRMQVQGELSEESEKTRSCYSLEGEGELLWSQSEVVENQSKRTLKVRQQVGIGYQVEATGVPARQVSETHDNLQQQQLLTDWLTDPSRREGDKFVAWSTDWEEDPVDTPLEVTFERTTQFVYRGVTQAGFEVKLRERGVLLQGSVDRYLHPQKVKAAGFLELVAEDPAHVRDMGRTAQWSDWGIPVDRPLSGREKLQELSLLASGPRAPELPQTLRQKVTAVDGGWRLDLRRGPTSSAALGANERQAALKLDHRMRCTPAMQQQASRLKTPQALVNWIHQQMKPTSGANAYTAQEVFQRRAGDCTEYSLLFVAMARSLGIPAREVLGCMYAGGKPPFFGWHQWAEYHDGQRWISVDAAWNQVDVDATHITFGYDVKDVSAVNYIGALKFRVLQTR